MTTLRTATPDGLSPIKDRSLNSPDQLVNWRAAWCEIQNRAFERLGILGEDGQILRVDHRSYEAQGVDLEPTVHLGVHATAMERKGITTELVELNREIVRLTQFTLRSAARRKSSPTQKPCCASRQTIIETPAPGGHNPRVIEARSLSRIEENYGRSFARTLCIAKPFLSCFGFEWLASL